MRKPQLSTDQRRLLTLLGDLCLPIVWVICGTFVAVAGYRFDPIDVDDPLGMGAFPVAIGVLLVVLGVVLGINELTPRSREGEAPPAMPATADARSPTEAGAQGVGELMSREEQDVLDEASRDEDSRMGRSLAVIALTAAYLFAMPRLGFLAATVIAASAIALVTARRLTIMLGLVYPVGLTGVLYYVFVELLGIRLP